MSFFKYTNISTASLVLKNKSIRWSSPSLYNDLEECQFTPFTEKELIESHKNYINTIEWYARGLSLGYDTSKFTSITKTLINLFRLSMNNGTYSKEKFMEYVLDANKNFENDYTNYINTVVIKCIRILCVTKIYDNKLMWAHYADQNYGCVIEFESLYNLKPNFFKEGFVKYHENLKSKSKPLDYLLYGETKEIQDLMIQDIIFSKRTVWDYEKEYRLMFRENFGEVNFELNMETREQKYTISNLPENLYTDVNFPIKSVKSIIFGARTKKEDKKKLIDIINKDSFCCKFYQMKIDNGNLIKEEIEIN
ncbi:MULTISPECIES: DUF2971 domain-containing protein [Tenacibaculum]|uniref:DUF2971 domain-containing protein n=1 Tax=Tenacibaculum TaxID=104267 RepID=UPI00187B4DEB|nr:DUF2971 domain-containing protein [Tenacibaculum finnmarkense]MBE7689071.1 DUF2971 domain-containing protein [Tenacibaculum finnmarkense genomovar ulcerans]